MRDDFRDFKFKPSPMAWYGVRRFQQWKRLEELLVGKGTGDVAKILGRYYDVHITSETYRDKHGKYMLRLHSGDNTVPLLELDL